MQSDATWNKQSINKFLEELPADLRRLVCCLAVHQLTPKDVEEYFPGVSGDSINASAVFAQTDEMLTLESGFRSALLQMKLDAEALIA